MRMRSLFCGDVRFQYKYGFYFVYLLFTVLYVGLLYAFEESWRQKAALIMVFSDPAAMGLYFMGAIVLLEKSQRVLDSLAVSPVRVYEYVLSKLFSIGVISVLVGLIIGTAGGAVRNPLLFVIGLFLCSCLFSAAGLIAACNVSTLNQFVLATIPAEILIMLPALAWLFGYEKSWLPAHPGVSLLRLCAGAPDAVFSLLILLLWTLLFVFLACRSAAKMLKSLGGVRL